MVGGIASEGRWCYWLPLECRRPLPLVQSSPSLVRWGGLIEWRGVVCWAAPCSDWGWRLALSCSPLALSRLSVCSLSQHCWFSAVSLWQGCVIVE